MRLEGNHWDEAALHALGAASVVRILDDAEAVLAVEVDPAIDIGGYVGKLADLEAARARAAVPKVISDRQFAYAIALMPDHLITLDEAEEWSAVGTLPQPLLDALALVPETEDGIPKRALARGKLRSATEYRLEDELTITLAALLNKDAAYLAAVWTLGASL